MRIVRACHCWVYVLYGLAAFASLQAGEAQPAGGAAVPELNDQSYRKWIDFVRPSAEESKWRQVGWRTALWPAVQEAKDLQRPLLLWTMNGHPCGHT